LRFSTRATVLWYFAAERLKNRLKRVKNQPNERSIQRVSRSFGASCERSSSAASAGDSVSELNAEITVEMAMVSENCW
jgi:hypothetical protein